jgi:2-polyprenyl-3-methyl-5-hydroxy-6-metoxy-1,4-benzoquinol methylase
MGQPIEGSNPSLSAILTQFAAGDELDPREPWNHDLHYDRWLLGTLPQPCGSILDFGCGEGLLAERLLCRATRVVGVDPHEPYALTWQKPA